MEDIEVDPFPEDLDHVDWSEKAFFADEAHIQQQAQEDCEIQGPSNIINESVSQHVNDEFKRFCKHQIDTKATGWDTGKRLPWRSDTALQKKVDELRISRARAAVLWLQLRRSRGYFEKIEIHGSSDNQLALYNSYTSSHFPSIRDAAIKTLNRRFQHHYDDDDDEEEEEEEEPIKLAMAYVFSEKHNKTLHMILLERVHQYNALLAQNIIGMTADNKVERLSRFMKGWQNSIQSDFLPKCRVSFPQIKNEVVFNEVFVCLENDVYKSWNKTMNEYMQPHLVSEIVEDDIENLILNAGGLLYFIAGWLLYCLTRIPGPIQDVALKFAQYNSLHVESDEVKNLPTEVTDTREKHYGKLSRVSSQFFHFVKLVEAIYKKNLNNPEIVWAFKDNLFCKLYEVTTDSSQIDSAFTACLPVETPIEHKEALLKVLLRKYNLMRAADYLKTLKNKAAKAQGIQDNFNTRSALVAVQLMASGQAPAAISGE